MNKKSTNRNSGGWLYSKDSNNRTKEYYPVLKKRKRKGCSAGINKYYFSPTTNFYKRTSTSENEIILTSLKGGKKIAKKFYLSNPNNKSVPSTSVHKNEEVIYTKEESIGVVNQREIENNFIVPSTNHKEADPTPVVQPPPKQPAPQLKTPPKETKFAVEKENLTRGTIRLTPGIKKWAKYYNLKVLDLICYANYIINYKLDNTGNSALKDWYDEHRIEVDNIIHLKVENTNTFEVRIFTEYELYNYEANKGKKSGLRKRFSGNARDLIVTTKYFDQILI
jgi:hypothetical protein